MVAATDVTLLALAGIGMRHGKVRFTFMASVRNVQISRILFAFGNLAKNCLFLTGPSLVFRQFISVVQSIICFLLIEFRRFVFVDVLLFLVISLNLHLKFYCLFE